MAACRLDRKPREQGMQAALITVIRGQKQKGLERQKNSIGRWKWEPNKEKK